MNIEDKLNILYDLLVDNPSVFEDDLIALIGNPALVSNTNKFASLLSTLKNPKFIEPLLIQINKSESGDVWLNDFLYAVSNLLGEISTADEFETPNGLIKKLSNWVLAYSGELAWMASGVLRFSASEGAELTQLEKLQGRNDFFLTYVNCLLGLLFINQEKHLPLLIEISADEKRDANLRQFCAEKLNDLGNQTLIKGSV